MTTRSHRRADRWVGAVTSLVLLGLITGVMGMQSARIRAHIPYLHRSVQSYTPSNGGVVISLGQPNDAPVASVPVAGVPDASPTADATTVAAAAPTATTAPTLAPEPTAAPTIVAAAAT